MSNIVDNNIYLIGKAKDVTYFITLFISLLTCLFIVFNYKNFNKKTYLILLISNIIETVLVIINYYNNITTIATSETFILYLLYLTIENPDLSIINSLIVSKEQALRASKEKSDFLTNMSHQIRTPINVIDGLSQLIETDTDIDSIKENTKDIRVASKNLVSLVNGILDISLLESGNIKINNKNYETYEMFDSVVELAKSMVINKKVEIKTNIARNIPTVLLGDAERIKQVLLNLLSNAIKFTKEGSVELKVTAMVSGSLCRLKMSVKDTGIGITKDNIHKIFNKFQKLDNTATSEGNGLGLVITQNIVDLMDGKIDVESEYGLGSIFTITIDQKIISPITYEEMLINKNNKEVKPFNCSGKKVLVVDDNRLNLKVAAKLLDSYNIEVTMCNSGEECLDIIDKNQDFDLILIDDMMPNMSGVETLEIFKKQERISGFSIPIVVLTANAVTGMKEEYLAKGFDDYLAKPIEKPELNRILKKFFEKSS
jgi:signal transduction histidine kinase/ActR/RegA family two-component response regulator